MVTLLNIARLRWRRVALLSLWVLAPAVFWAIFNPTTLNGNVTLGCSLLSILVTFMAFRPEETARLEVQATQPLPLGLSVLHEMVVAWVGIWAASVVTMLTFSIIAQTNSPATCAFYIGGYAALIIFLGATTWLGTVLGREARVGGVSGLFVLAWIRTFPGIWTQVPATYSLLLLDGSNDPLAWGLYRLGYILIGLGMCWVSLQSLQNVESFLIGKIPRINARKRPTRRRTFLSRPLPAMLPRKWAWIGYESLISIFQGPIPIVMLVLWLTLGIIMLSQAGWPSINPMLVETVTLYLLFNLRLFGLLILPATLFFTAIRDRHVGAEPLMLSMLSPRAYLRSKVLGTVLGVWVSFFVGALPITLLSLPVLTHHPLYARTYLLNLFLAVYPFLTYITVISVIIGNLLPPKYVIWGVAGTTLILVCAGGTTATSYLGNILFPSGQLLADNLSYTIYTYNTRHLGGAVYVPAELLLTTNTWLLLSPLISLTLQLLFLWLLGSRIYERQVTKA